MSSNPLLPSSCSPPGKDRSPRSYRLSLGCLLLTCIGLLAPTQNASAQFFAGDLVVSQVGTGSAALSSAGTAVFLQDYSTTGALKGTLALPTSDSGANKGIVSSGTATSEGALSLSSDGHYLVYTGYNAAVGTAGVATGSAARVVARIDSSGNVDTTTALTDAYGTGNIRSAVTTDGIHFYTGGTGTAANGGVRYTTLGSTTSTQLSTTVTNIRDVNIAFGQLYVSSASGSNIGVSSVGVGLPINTGNTITLLPGFSAGTALSPYDYVVASSTVIYVADDGASGSASRGLQKWVLINGTWTLEYKVTAGLAGGLRGLTASVNGGVATLYGVTTETSANKLVTFTDNLADSATGNVFTVISTAPANTVFRGVNFAPVAAAAGPVPTPEPGGPMIALIGGSLIVLLRRRKARRL